MSCHGSPARHPKPMQRCRTTKSPPTYEPMSSAASLVSQQLAALDGLLRAPRVRITLAPLHIQEKNPKRYNLNPGPCSTSPFSTPRQFQAEPKRHHRAGRRSRHPRPQLETGPFPRLPFACACRGSDRGSLAPAPGYGPTVAARSWAPSSSTIPTFNLPLVIWTGVPLSFQPLLPLSTLPNTRGRRDSSLPSVPLSTPNSVTRLPLLSFSRPACLIVCRLFFLLRPLSN